MDPYQTPHSNLNAKFNAPYQPIRGMIYGLLVSIGLMFIVSIVLSLAFIFWLGLDLRNPTMMSSTLYNSLAYLTSDLLVSFLILFYAGWIASKYTPNREIKFASILSLLTLAINFIVFIDFEELSDGPLWYQLSSLIIIFVGIFSGARLRINNQQQ